MNDPYTDTYNCVKRLFQEWQKYGRLIVACDFDDTVFPFHDKDNKYDRVFSLLRKCQELDFYIVIFTASRPERYDMMYKYMEENGIKISGINKNPIQLPFGNNGKIYYNILLDDRAGLGQAVQTLEMLIKIIEDKKRYNIGV